MRKQADRLLREEHSRLRKQRKCNKVICAGETAVRPIWLKLRMQRRDICIIAGTAGLKFMCNRMGDTFAGGF